MSACPICERSFPTDRERYLHTMNEHTTAERGEPLPVGLPTTRTVPAEYAEARARRSAKRLEARAGLRMRTRLMFRPRFSDVATDGACPRCQGQSFKSKRSALGKSAGLLLGGIGLLLVSKSEVECETCGQKFRRG